MSYSTSEQLAQLLVKHGFSEKTKQEYPEDYEEVVAGNYNPEIHRRAFKYGQHFLIYFEQGRLRAVNGFFGFKCAELREGEIRAILTYIRLPNHTKTAMQNRCRTILEIEKEYKKIKKQEESDRSITDKRIVDMFESIALPVPNAS